jgi:hypothetical protein
MNSATTISMSGSRSFVVRRKSDNEQPPRSKPQLWQIVKHALPLTRSREVNIYRLWNLVNIWRGFWRIAIARVLKVPHAYGTLYATLIRANGEILNLGLVSMRVVTDAGVGSSSMRSRTRSSSRT